MEKFKKLFRKQLKVVPLAGLILIIFGSIIYEIWNSTFTELPREEFLAKAIENKVTRFSRAPGYSYEMITPSGEKYSHQFTSYDDKEDFEQEIIREFQTFGHHNKFSFYLLGIPIILGIIATIFLLNIVILWFVALYDLLSSEFTEDHNKWIWFLSLLILPLLAPVFYLFISGKQKRVAQQKGVL